MPDNEKMNDPLAALVNKEAAAINGEKITPVSAPLFDEEVDTPAIPTTPSVEDEDDEYGNNDLLAEIEAEEEMERRMKQAKAEELAAKIAEKQKTDEIQPPDDRDMRYHDDAIGYQTEKLSVVSGMVNRVVAKYRLISGAIPEKFQQDKQGKPILSRHALMGELIDLYHRTGDRITPDFENMILANWIMPDGTRAINNIDEKTGFVVDTTIAPVATKNESVTNKASETIDGETSEPIKHEAVPTVNITVDKEAQENHPVNINIDKEITGRMGNIKEVNVLVKEVSKDEILKSIIYKNSEKTGIINVYDPGINDVTVTLPSSGYRCSMRSVNWFDFIKLTAPAANDGPETELKRWSVIYKHIKNPSIGDFKNFEDFLKKTKYKDRELLLWAILVATSDDEESLNVVCGNPDCRHSISIKYEPRNIKKTDESKEPVWYQRAQLAAPGDEAREVWEEANNRHILYTLPHSKIIVELSEPSAYDFINTKLKLVNDLYKRYRPEEKDMKNLNINDLSMAEFDYLSANALYIESLTIIPTDENGQPTYDKDGKIQEYAFTNWNKIEEIVTECLDGVDSATLLKVIQQSQEDTSPISFRVENVVCPECGRVEKVIPINDIGQSLLFQLSRRLENIQINLTDSPKK